MCSPLAACLGVFFSGIETPALPFFAKVSSWPGRVLEEEENVSRAIPHGGEVLAEAGDQEGFQNINSSVGASRCDAVGF